MNFHHGLLHLKMHLIGYLKMNLCDLFKLIIYYFRLKIIMNPKRIFEILDVQLKNNPIENCMSENKDGIGLIYQLKRCLDDKSNHYGTHEIKE